MTMHDFERAYDEADSEIAAGLFAIAIALNNLAVHVKYLGNGNAATQMGAIEGLSMQIKEGLQTIAASIER